MKNAFALLGGCLLAGCSVRLIQPDATQQVSDHYSTSGPISGAALDVNWSSNIGDAQQTEVLALSHANSPDLRSAAANVIAARAQAGQSDAALVPSVSGSVSTSAAATDFDTRATSSAALLDASWEVDLFGRVRNMARADAVRARAKVGGLPSPKAFRVASFPADMLRQRPDVVAAEQTFAASLLDLKVAQANFYPS